MFIMADFCASCMRLAAVVFCAPGIASDAGTYFDIEEIALSTALCGSEPTGRSAMAFCKMLMASRTWDKDWAFAPGDPVGTAFGAAPIGGAPLSEGGSPVGKLIEVRDSLY